MVSATEGRTRERNKLEVMLHDAASRLSAAHVAALVAHPGAVRSALAAADALTANDRKGRSEVERIVGPAFSLVDGDEADRQLAARRRPRSPRRSWRRRRRELPGADAEPALIDLRGDGPVRIGAPSAGKLPKADGFVFASRFTGDSCVAIFERALGRLRPTGIAELVRHTEFLEALDDYDIVLTGPLGRTA